MSYSMKSAARATCALLLLFFLTGGYAGEAGAGVRGQVTLKDNGKPVRGAEVIIVQLERSTLSDDEGNFSFPDVPAGSYEISAHLHSLTGAMRRVEVAAGQEVTVDLQLALVPLRQEVVVTASGRASTVFDAFQSVATLDTLELGEHSSFSLGDVVDGEPGVHKRSFGPGSARPVIRGFDGDRVLVLSDGLQSGTLSSQSGEHAEPVDAANLDSVEIVKGPATLLYGASAIGGVVNMTSGHHDKHEEAHPGLRGSLTTLGGTNGNQAAAHANAEYGYKNWLVTLGGSRQVASDYSSPLGRVVNSKTRMTSGNLGVGWFGAKPFFSFSYGFDKGRFGVPFAGDFHHHAEEEEEAGEHEHEHEHGEEGEHEHEHEHEHAHEHGEEAPLIDETFTRQDVRLNIGARHLEGFFEEFRVATNFSRWMHKELEREPESSDEEMATEFDNKLFNLRATLSQRKSGKLTGTSGLQFFHRDYSAEGEEALAPPTTANGIAFFTLQELDLERVRLQLGGRVDHTGYDPESGEDRSFTGFSGAAGIHVPLGKNTAFVVNYTHSYRAPALEELYNHGPHIGNLVYEIGDATLEREMADGVDMSLRWRSPRFTAEANFYYYGIRDFVYLALTGAEAHGLREAAYAQANARFVGGEVLLGAELIPVLWANAALDTVNAELSRNGMPLPRIPPLRGKVGLDARWRGFSFKPEIVMAAAQGNVSPAETRTPGYTTVSFDASYTLARTHYMHVFSAQVFNIGDRLYRNHLSFIKDLAPEMGRGVRFTYNLRFF